MTVSTATCTPRKCWQWLIWTNSCCPRIMCHWLHWQNSWHLTEMQMPTLWAVGAFIMCTLQKIPTTAGRQRLNCTHRANSNALRNHIQWETFDPNAFTTRRWCWQSIFTTHCGKQDTAWQRAIPIGHPTCSGISTNPLNKRLCQMTLLCCITTGTILSIKYSSNRSCSHLSTTIWQRTSTAQNWRKESAMCNRK